MKLILFVYNLIKVFINSVTMTSESAINEENNMLFDISQNIKRGSQNELLNIQKLDTNSQWLKSLVPPDLTDRKFFVSLYEGLKDDKEFNELMESTKKISNTENLNKSVVDSVYYDKLSKTNAEMKRKFLLIETKLLDQVLKEESHSYKNQQHTHSGFAYYLYYAWSKELGICLRPDMIFYTILCETVSFIMKNQKGYKHLFTDSYTNNKTFDIKVQNGEHFDNNKMNETLSTIISYQELKDVATKKHFKSQPDNFSYVSNFCFVKMASAYFNFLTSFCGIPKIEILGDSDDWVELLASIRSLSSIVPELSQYYERCNNTIGKIVNYVFSKNKTEAIRFLSEIFWLEDPCKSGHTHEVKGWFSHFYVNDYTSLEDFPSHANYVPFTNMDSNKKFIKAVGMTYSMEKENILYAQYGEITYEVLHQGIFNILLSCENIELSNEEKCKSMIKSMNTSMGYIPTNEEVEKIYTNNFKERNNNPDVTLVSKFLEVVGDTVTITGNVMKENWKTTLFVTTVIGAIGMGSIVAKMLNK